ncbi:MAG: alpha/beta fold hydrolase [Gemmatimonadales bacterium]
MLTNILVALSATMGRADTTGYTPSGLWFSATGTGPAVVLLHGATLDSRAWGSLPGEIARHHRVVLTDLRSHGRSRDATAPFSWAEDVIEVMDAAGIDRAILIGHSLGAQIAIDAALQSPERITGLVLLGPSVGGLPPTRAPAGMDSLVAALRAGDWPGTARALAAMPTMKLMRDSTERSLVRSILADNVRLFRVDRTWVKPLDPPALGRLGQIAVPTLVVLGGLDPTEDEAASQVLLARVPAARATTLPGCGHLLPVDCPAETTQVVASFVSAPTRRTP